MNDDQNADKTTPGPTGPSTLGNSDQTDLTWPTQSTRHAQNTVAARRATVSMRRSERKPSIHAPARRATCIRALERGATRIHPHSITKLVPVQPTLETFFSPIFLLSSDKNQTGGAWTEKGNKDNPSHKPSRTTSGSENKV
jgi:hypothetical protein